jgi:hypothetical protein
MLKKFPNGHNKLLTGKEIIAHGRASLQGI